MAWVQNTFGIQSEEFWELVGILHKNELVDMYEDEVVRISDQVLSTYFFYLSVFEKKIIPFSLIVSDFYPDFKRTIVDALNPVINAFDQMKIVKEIRGEIKDIFDAISRAEKQSDSIKFLNSFWFALPTETLIFANKAISEIQQVDIVWENEIFEEAKDGPDESSLVSLLSNFRNYKNKEFKLSFDLLLNYLEKDKQSLGHIIRELKDKYNFKPKDQRYGYLIQIHIVNTLIERMNNGGNYLFTRLFMLVAEYYLKVEHTEYQWARGGDSLSMITFKLSPDDYLRPLRKKLFEHLSGLLNIVKYKDNAQAVFQEYFSHFKYEVKEIALADLPYIKDYFVNNLNHTDISHCMMIQELCKDLEALDIDFPIEWKSVFTNKILELSNLLLEDRYEKQILKMRYTEYCKYRHQLLVNHFSSFTKEDFIIFMKQCVILHRSLSGRERDYSLKDGINKSINAFAETHERILADIISIYLDYDDIFELNPHTIISNLFKILTVDDVWKLINSKAYRWKKSWCSLFFSLIPGGKNIYLRLMLNRY